MTTTDTPRTVDEALSVCLFCGGPSPWPACSAECAEAEGYYRRLAQQARERDDQARDDSQAVAS